MAFKMKMKGFPKVTEGETKKGNEEFKARSAPVPGKGEYEGQMVDPRTCHQVHLNHQTNKK